MIVGTTDSNDISKHVFLFGDTGRMSNCVLHLLILLLIWNLTPIIYKS